MSTAADLQACRELIRTGSRSFHAASLLLPARVRDPALALYAFCRLADDAVDETAPDAANAAKARAVLRLHDRLEAVYAGRPANTPADRAFAALVEAHELPRTLPDALLEGLAWDADGRRHDSLSEVRAYSARVASAVGAMMCVLMGVRDADRLARACDLGVAMQLTNIARDVGEDARAGRIYLPMDWLAEAGIDPDRFLHDPQPIPPIRTLTERLLREADRLYQRSDPGIAALPRGCRPGIFAARHIYAGIGGVVRRQGGDSISRRAVTGTGSKLGWLALSYGRGLVSMVTPRHATLHARPLPEVAWLVSAATRASAAPSRSDTLIAALGVLRARDLTARAMAAQDRTVGRGMPTT